MIAARATASKRRLIKQVYQSQKVRHVGLKLAILCLILAAFLSVGTQAKFQKYTILASGTVLATAYNSLEGQTDSSPWITASGTRCREGVIASNFLPLGTKVKIEGFKNRVFVVEDRMNRRYHKRIDIWFRHYHEAKNFGVRKIKYQVIKTA